MDLMRALRFPFEDRDWIVKVMVGSLLCLVPFIGIGYQVSVARNVIRNRQHPLPGTNELGLVIADTVMAAIAGLIYAIPLLPFICVMSLISGVSDGSDIGAVFVLCLSCCVGLFALLYAIPALAIYSMGVIRYSETGSFSSFIQVGSLWRDVMDNTGVFLNLLLYSLLVGLAAVVIAPVAVVACVLPVLALIFFASVVTGHLIGQAGLQVIQV